MQSLDYGVLPSVLQDPLRIRRPGAGSCLPCCISSYKSAVNRTLIGNGGKQLVRKGGPVLPTRACMSVMQSCEEYRRRIQNGGEACLSIRYFRRSITAAANQWQDMLETALYPMRAVGSDPV